MTCKNGNCTKEATCAVAIPEKDSNGNKTGGILIREVCDKCVTELGVLNKLV